MLTVALALLISLILVVWVDVLRLSDPVQVTFQIFFQLLFLTQLLKVSPSFGLFSLLGELSGLAETHIDKTCKQIQIDRMKRKLQTFTAHSNSKEQQDVFPENVRIALLLF